jgi:8-oxo-dGTP pyrophosphatase MutT (NUDIX family)
MERFTSASIVPFAFVSDSCLEPVVLLARERRIPQHALRPRQQRAAACTAFGGGRLPSDRDIEDTAAREFCEESLLSVRLYPTQGFTDMEASRDLIRRSLRSSQFAFRVPVDMPGTHKMHMMFLVQVAFDPGVARRFNVFQQLLRRARSRRSVAPPGFRHRFLSQHPALKTDRSVRQEYLEKATVEFVSLAWVERCVSSPPPSSSEMPQKHDISRPSARLPPIRFRAYMRRRMQHVCTCLREVCRARLSPSTPLRDAVRFTGTRDVRKQAIWNTVKTANANHNSNNTTQRTDAVSVFIPVVDSSQP